MFSDDDSGSDEQIVQKTPSNKPPKGQQVLSDKKIRFQLPGKNTPGKNTPKDNSLVEKKQSTPLKVSLKELQGMMGKITPNKNGSAAMSIVPPAPMANMAAAFGRPASPVDKPQRTCSVSSQDSPTGVPPPLIEWAVSQSAKLNFTQLFNSYDKTRTGFLTGAQAKNILVSTGLSQPVLAQIWSLSDTVGDGRLSCEEFVIAMHLAESVKAGDALPGVLPPELIPPSHRCKRSTSIQSAGSGSSHADGDINLLGDQDVRTLFIGSLPLDTTAVELKALSSDTINVSITSNNTRRKPMISLLNDTSTLDTSLPSTSKASEEVAVDKIENHDRRKKLPFLIIEGVPTTVEKMTLMQLRHFIPFMLKCSTDGLELDKKSIRPDWWPKYLPLDIINHDSRTAAAKKKISSTAALRHIVRSCYVHHGREDLLSCNHDKIKDNECTKACFPCGIIFKNHEEAEEHMAKHLQ